MDTVKYGGSISLHYLCPVCSLALPRYQPIPHAFEPQTIITKAAAGKLKAGCGEDHLLLGHKVLKPLHHSIEDATVVRADPK